MNDIWAIPILWKVILGVVAFVGSGTIIGLVVKMITRPRLRLLYQPDIADDAEVSIRYAGAVDQAEVDGTAFFVRAFLWNYGHSTAEDCTVSVDGVWFDDEQIARFARSPLKWTHKDVGAERFAARKLLAGKANGIRVDVCKTDTVNPYLQILSEASHAGTGYHWYEKSGTYIIELIAQSSSFWANPARCSIAVEFIRTESMFSLRLVGCAERRHLLKMI